MSKKEIWMLQTKRADFHGLAARLGVSPVLVRIMRNRGLETEEEMRKYLFGTPDELYDGSLMKDMGMAVGILEEKLRDGVRVRIIGDPSEKLWQFSHRTPETCRKRTLQTDPNWIANFLFFLLDSFFLLFLFLSVFFLL